MIVDCGKYYLYRHIRLDKNEPFYIGIGTKRKGFENKESVSGYYRSKCKDRQNPHWHRIIAKTDFRIDILLETNDLEFLKSKEIEFIKLYGRRDLKTGTLCNMTDGGDGSFGHIKSPELIELMRENSIGRIVSEETKYKQREAHKKRRELGLKNKPISTESRKKQSETMRRLFKERGIPEKCKPTLFKKGQISTKAIEVLNVETGIYYNSIMEASMSIGMNRKILSKKLKGVLKNNTSLILLNNEL